MSALVGEVVPTGSGLIDVVAPDGERYVVADMLAFDRPGRWIVDGQSVDVALNDDHGFDRVPPTGPADEAEDAEEAVDGLDRPAAK